MKYVLMCGGNYSDRFKIPKQLLKVNGEVLVERTIRLLRENGIKDIAISTSSDKFDYLDVEILKVKNEYVHDDPERNRKSSKSWLNAYYPMKEPCCYLHGDVYFSENAIKTIVVTKVKDTMFFCTRDIYDGRPMGINIKGREPLAYKVENQELFRNAINELFSMIDDGIFSFDPISWNLYRKINGLPLVYDWFGSDIFNRSGDYIVIDDYTTDVDAESDIFKIEQFFKMMKGELKMVKAEVIEQFHLSRFNELIHIVRNPNITNPEVGMLYGGDTFECSEEMAEYLTGKNPLNKPFIKVLEVIPSVVVVETKPTKRTRKKK